MRRFFNFITVLSLRFRWLVILLSALVMVLGVQSWSQMNQELLPPVEFPSSFVIAFAGGLNSTQISNLYTIPLENEIAEIDDILNIETTTSPGLVFLNLANEFGVNRSELNEQINDAINRVWLPSRHLRPSSGENGTEFAARLLNDLDGATLTYLASTDPTLLLELSSDTWAALSPETILETLPLFARQTSSADENATTLQRFISETIIPELLDLEDVADASINGGESIERLMGEIIETNEGAGSTSSLLLQLDSASWQIISEKTGLNRELNQVLADSLAAESIVLPDAAPELPDSWITPKEIRFRTADDIIEVVSLTSSLGQLLNNFTQTGEIRGPLGQTDDLDAESIRQMLEIDPSFAYSFDEEQLLALPSDLFTLLPEDVRVPSDARIRRLFSLKEMGADLLGYPGNPVPVNLPNTWRTSIPTILNFSFDDLPIAIFSISGIVDITSSDETVSDIPMPQIIEGETGEEGPELPAIFPAMASLFGLELDTADDLLTIELPHELAESFGISQLNAAQFLNTMAQLAGVDFTEADSGGGASLNIGSLFAAISECSVENELNPSQVAGLTTAGSGIVITCINADTLTWLADADPSFTASLSADVYSFLPDLLLKLDIPGFAPPLGGNSWDTLLSDYTGGKVTTDSLTLLAESAAQALNLIATPKDDPTFNANSIRLLDEISPIAFRTIALRDDTFLSSLDNAALLGLSRENITDLLASEFDLEISDDLRSELEAIEAGAPTALESWQAENIDEQQFLIEEGHWRISMELSSTQQMISFDSVMH